VKTYAAILVSCMVVMLSGCATSGKLREMKRQRDVLAAELGVVKDQNRALETEKKTLQDTIGGLTDIRSSLEREKDARKLEATSIRRQAREFLQLQLGHLRAFSRNHDLLDRIGGELIARNHVEEARGLLVDMKHPLPSSGTLVSGDVFSRGPCSVSFCLLRPQGDELAMIWTSPLFKITKEGLHAFPFDVPVGVEKGDHVGIYCPDALRVPYDKGTGSTGRVDGPPRVGATVKKSALVDRDGKTYSFAVSGFLD
jgi:hypothetical protein